MFYIGKSSTERRATHWRDIQTRVTTHEGEFLSGSKGIAYQKKWSRKYLGKDLSVGKATADTVEQHEKTHKQ